MQQFHLNINCTIYNWQHTGQCNSPTSTLTAPSTTDSTMEPQQYALHGPNGVEITNTSNSLLQYTDVRAHFYSAGIKHGNLHESVEMTRWVTGFIPWAIAKLMQAKPKRYGEDLETMNGKGLGRLKTKQGNIPGSGQSMQGYILTYSRLLRGNVC